MAIKPSAVALVQEQEAKGAFYEEMRATEMAAEEARKQLLSLSKRHGDSSTQAKRAKSVRDHLFGRVKSMRAKWRAMGGFLGTGEADYDNPYGSFGGV